MADSEKDISDE